MGAARHLAASLEADRQQQMAAVRARHAAQLAADLAELESQWDGASDVGEQPDAAAVTLG